MWSLETRLLDGKHWRPGLFSELWKDTEGLNITNVDAIVSVLTIYWFSRSSWSDVDLQTNISLYKYHPRTSTLSSTSTPVTFKDAIILYSDRHLWPICIPSSAGTVRASARLRWSRVWYANHLVIKCVTAIYRMAPVLSRVMSRPWPVLPSLCGQLYQLCTTQIIFIRHVTGLTNNRVSIYRWANTDKHFNCQFGNSLWISQ